MAKGRKRWHAYLALAGAVAVVASVGVDLESEREINTTRMVTETSTVDELAGELRILQISDIHVRDNPEQIAHVVDMARESNPHIIVIAGDTLNTWNESLDPLVTLFTGLAQIGVPMYAVLGNHDHWSKDLPQLRALYARYGVELIDNEHRVLTGDYGTFTLVGAGDAFTSHAHLSKALENAPAEGFRFLLTHAPEIVDQLEQADIDYAVCGHTHGGQIALPLIGALYAPGQGLFPKYSRGFYQVGKARLYVDSGLGYTEPRIRFLVQSQIVLHVLHP